MRGTLLRRRRLLARFVALPLIVLAHGPALAQSPSWDEVLKTARGQTVYFNAWGGSPQINDYLAWAGAETERRFGVRLVHVKLTDTAEAVSRVLAERTAGRNSGGSVDLIWINGENFKAMKENGLLFGPFTQLLPNFRLVDTEHKPTTLLDFTIATDGFESPWGMAQFVFLYDSARLPAPPRDPAGLLDWITRNPGRFTYPAPPDFIGSTFLKHLLVHLGSDSARLAVAPDRATFDALAAPVWRWLDAARPHLWRGGRTYPANKEALHQLLDDGEVALSMAFNPSEASSLIRAGRLPPTVRTLVPGGGTIGNTHFVAIPFNAAHKEGAMVAADFLLSPEAQARKQDEAVWGDPTVLDLARLAAADRARFERLERGPATPSPEALATVLSEPHPAWMEQLERAWAERYAR